MKALMYGAGNIGRGFIAKRFYLSGYHTVFVDLNLEVIDALNRDGKYPIYVTRGSEYVPEWVENCSGLDGRDVDAVIAEIAECDILATSLGVNALKFVAENLARGIHARRVGSGKPLNILICENLVGAEDYLRGLVAPYVLPEDEDYFQNQVGFVGVCVGITVPPTPEKFKEENLLACCSDLYTELPCDRLAFRPVGCETPEIDGLLPFTPFEFYIERKLFIHNLGHAMMAYLGAHKGLEYIYDIGKDPEIKYILSRALCESATALSLRHGARLDELMKFVTNLIPRLDNPLLPDTILRVGKDPKRKVAAGDRLGGAFKMVREQGMVPAHIAVGLAAAYLFELPEDPISLEVSGYAKEQGIEAALAKYSDITAPEDVALVGGFYDMLSRGASFGELVEVLDSLTAGH